MFYMIILAWHGCVVCFLLLLYSEMSTSSNSSDDKPTPPEKTTVVLLLGTIGDTTWRMFVPTVGLTILGVIGDNMFATKPWLTVGGIIIGIIGAALLVRRQLKGIKK
ncbi:TPA: hypothetical protein DDX46_01095 [Candidatus Saccharibacteria bacterium]|nr:hypothetical protein [Candidatus Saccharibacteria bacterium]